MTELKAAAVGFLVASFIPVVTLMILSAFTEANYSAFSFVDGLLAFYLPTALFVVLFGLPAFVLLRPFAPGHWWSVFAAGFLLGTLVSLVIQQGHLFPKPLLIDGMIGGVTALAFWMIWRRGWIARRTAES